MVEKVDYYRLFTNGHNGFSKELYLYLKKEGLISSSYEALANKNNGINYELYKIIQNNHPTEPALMTYRAMELSKEGVEYWLANSLYEVMRMYNAYFIVKDENNVPLSNVAISVGDSFTRTNAEGIGIISLKNGVYQVFIGKYGYKNYDDSITIKDEDYVGNVSLKILTTFDDVNTIVDNAISSIEAFKHVIVSELPDVGDKNTIYLIEESSTSHVTVFKSYIYLNNQWCNIGNQIVDLSDYYTKLEADNVINTKIGSAIAGITSYKMIIVDKLPETGDNGLIYLTKENPDDEFYIMNVWISNEWVEIGSTKIDLSNYYTKSDTDSKINESIIDALSDYYNRNEVSSKINMALNNYDTRSEVNTKIEDAISEVNQFYCQFTHDLPVRGDKNTIYITPSTNPNLYDEWICLYNVLGKEYNWFHIASGGDLTNYYTKDETNNYVSNKLNSYYTQTETNEYIENKLETVKYQIVNPLPADGAAGVFYLLKKVSETGNVSYDEYIYTDNQWKKINTDVDLTNYYTKTETSDLINESMRHLTRYKLVDKKPDVSDLKPEDEGVLFIISEGLFDDEDEPEVWTPIAVKDSEGGKHLTWHRISPSFDDYPTTNHVRMMIALGTGVGVLATKLADKFGILSKGYTLASEALNEIRNFQNTFQNTQRALHELVDDYGDNIIDGARNLRGAIGQNVRENAERIVANERALEDRFRNIGRIAERREDVLNRGINNVQQVNERLNDQISHVVQDNSNLRGISNSLNNQIRDINQINNGLQNNINGIRADIQNNLMNQGRLNADHLNRIVNSQRQIEQMIHYSAGIDQHMNNVENVLTNRINGLIRNIGIGASVGTAGVGVLGSTMYKGLWQYLSPISEAELQSNINNLAIEILLLED